MHLARLDGAAHEVGLRHNVAITGLPGDEDHGASALSRGEGSPGADEEKTGDRKAPGLEPPLAVVALKVGGDSHWVAAGLCNHLSDGHGLAERDPHGTAKPQLAKAPHERIT